MFRRLWGGAYCGIHLPCPMVGGHFGVYPYYSGYFLFSLGGVCMQVVVVKSPKILKGVLKLIFGIKKSDQ